MPLNNTLNTVIKFIFEFLWLTMNERVYSVFYFLNFRNLYHKNVSLSFHKIRNDIADTTHIHNTLL